jgi:beta-1,4-mannosyltransferase
LTVDRPLRVLQSFPEPRPTTNPYLVMLRQALDEVPGVQVETFTWRRALAGRYDVFHVHWPEILLRGTSPAKTVARRVLTVAFVVRMALTRRSIVRTLHNTGAHEAGSGVENAILRLIDRRTAVFIRLNPHTPTPWPRSTFTILHGHYRTWFERHPRGSAEPGRAAYFGLIRPYKGVPPLIRTFTALPDERLSLAVLGKPSDAALEAEVREAAAGDDRVDLTLDYVDDATLARELGRAGVVVLPYSDMHNSGAALLALSLGRPVLVPDNAVTRDLAAEVGEDWVHRFSGELSGPQLAAAAARPFDDRSGPDLSAREWPAIGEAHRTAYRRAARRA